MISIRITKRFLQKYKKNTALPKAENNSDKTEEDMELVPYSAGIFSLPI